MGNKVSQDTKGGQSSFGQQFRVYIHRRNKIFHAWLRITPDDIFLEKSKTDVISWPLQLIRRYGYTSAGVFFFESGRRCPTGEGLHCFQTQNADIIFQLVQQRIQDNANVKKAENMLRNERAQSSGPVLHSSLGHHSSSSRLNQIQRFGSEGGGVGSEYLTEPSGYNTYHQDTQAASRLRKVVLPPPPRPRSVGGEDDHPTHLPPASFHPKKIQNSYGEQRIIGNILSESRNPSVFDDSPFSSTRRDSSNSQTSTGSNSHQAPYVNISPQEVLASPRSRADSMSSQSNRSVVSVPGTPTRTAIPLKWNVGAGSTNVICYAQPSPSALNRSPHLNSPNDANGNGMDGVFRYVNVSEVGGRVLLEKGAPVSPPLNYADVTPGEQERVPSRCSSIGQRSEREQGAVNYTLIDAEKTRALQAAAAATSESRTAQSGAMRRRNLTGGN